MDDFQKEKLNVLVATTIIENGIDLPKVNTIIIEDATKLGLSQAYQIRGRVGRSFTQGFAYLFYEDKNLTPLAKDRLNALKEAEELGSGYRIALRDLELRGAGNILGKEQSGSINKIGLNLYCQVLSEAVEKMRKN
jgi:transcription-repair coupling factor (superfamily II helicase)